MKTVRQMIVDATSDMLDSPDEHGIYPTSVFYDRLEKEIYEQIDQERIGARMNEHHVLSKLLSNEEIAAIPNVIKLFKRRFAELKDLRWGKHE